MTSLPDRPNTALLVIVTQSYRTRHPMHIVAEVPTWESHPPATLQAMLDNLARFRENGLDVIED